MIASHYAEPVERSLTSAATLRSDADAAADSIADLAAGSAFTLLDDSRGWAWGYAGDERLVGYVPSGAIA